MIIFLPNGFGDMIMALPAINFAIENCKKSNVVLVVLTEGHKKLVELFIPRNLKYIVRRDGKAFGDIRLYFKLLKTPTNSIVAPMVSNKFFHKLFFSILPKRLFSPLQLLKIAPGVNVRLPFSLNTFEGHQVNFLIQAVSFSLGLPAKSISYLELHNKSKAHRRERIQICLGMFCGALERHKVPSVEYFCGLVSYLDARLPADFHVIATDADNEKLEKFNSMLDANINLTIYKNQSFEELSRVIVDLDVGVSGMSGQGHLMSAFGLPMVIFSGVTNPKESAPFVKRAVICRHNFACGPCYQETFLRGCGSINCMDHIPYDTVLSGIKYLMTNSMNGADWYDRCNEVTLPVEKLIGLIGLKIVQR